MDPVRFLHRFVDIVLKLNPAALAQYNVEDSETNNVQITGCAVGSIEELQSLIDQVELVFPALTPQALGLVEAGTHVRLDYTYDLAFPPELVEMAGYCHLGINALFSAEITDGPLVVDSYFSNVWSGMTNLEGMPDAFDKYVILELPAGYTGAESIDQTLTITIDFGVQPLETFNGDTLLLN